LNIEQPKLFRVTTRNEFVDYVVVKELGVVAAADGASWCLIH
jgi:hypothetical protein